MVQKLAFAFLLILFSRSLAAQQPAPAWGVDGLSTYVMTAWDMQMSGPSIQWTFDVANLHRYATSAGYFIGVAHLPQGAQIVSIELEACDDSGGTEVNSTLLRAPLQGGTTTLAMVATGLGATPGCLFTSADLGTPETVNNSSDKYVVYASHGSHDGTTTFGAVRIRYRLQVSPAPAVATFGDVPTSDPAFQFIEALAASGITAGCGGGNYCPDAPLTRRQMSVFLARALGLHWPDGPLF